MTDEPDLLLANLTVRFDMLTPAPNHNNKPIPNPPTKSRFLSAKEGEARYVVFAMAQL
jgi:hypothetical protein